MPSTLNDNALGPCTSPTIWHAMMLVTRRALQRSQGRTISLAARPPHRATALAATQNFLHHHSAPSLAAPRPPNARTLTTQKPQEPEPPRSKLAAFAALARVDAPAGTLLLYWPGAWSIALAAPPAAAPDASLLALFGVGAFVMRGAGCTINDIWDRDVDGAVARTRRRPLASGELAAPEAAAFLAAQLCLGLGVLSQLNWASVQLGAASVPLVLAYPLAKRVTTMPQVALALTFNWGAFLGYCQGRKRVIQRRFNVSVPRARISERAPTLRERSER